jgi:hypothetical protein
MTPEDIAVILLNSTGPEIPSLIDEIRRLHRDLAIYHAEGDGPVIQAALTAADVAATRWPAGVLATAVRLLQAEIGPAHIDADLLRLLAGQARLDALRWEAAFVEQGRLVEQAIADRDRTYAAYLALAKYQAPHLDGPATAYYDPGAGTTGGDDLGDMAQEDTQHVVSSEPG